MSSKDAVLASLRRTGVVAVIRTDRSADLVNVAKALSAGGVRFVEITMTVPGALEIIRESIARLQEHQVYIGAGTVLDAAAAGAAMDAGARFIVAPAFDPETVRLCNARGVLVMPGAFTPHEILQAWRGGADVVKVFPADIGGPEFIKTIKEPLPHIELLPTKGIDLETAPAFIKAGALAVGAGSALVSKGMFASKDYARMTANATEFIRVVRAAKGE